MEKSLACANKLREVGEGTLRGRAAVDALQAARIEVEAIEMEMCNQALAAAEAFQASMRVMGDEIARAIERLTERAALMGLVLDWEQSARSQLQCGERTDDPMGKRLVQHGGMCYFNCAQALRRHLDAAAPQPSPTQEERQTPHRQRV